MPEPDETIRLRLRLRQQGLVARLGSQAMRAEGLQPVLDEACRLAAEGLETPFAKVMRHEPATDDFLVVAGTGWRPGVVGQVRLGSGTASPAGYAFLVHEPVLTEDIEAERRFAIPPMLPEHGIRSAINVLVQAGDAPPFGVLEVDGTRRHEFVQEDVAFVQALGNILAEAAQAQARGDELRALLAQNRALLAEKELLMQEVHHRVMNSLGLVRGLLSLQADTLAPGEARAQLETAAARIMSIAAAHRTLHQGGSVAGGDGAAYLRGLLAQLDALQPQAAPIALEAEPVELSAEELPRLGLIVTELVTNAMKHGQRPVRVAVRRLADGLEVTVEDAGPGFPPDHEAAPGTGLGMRLLRSLAGAGEAALRVDRGVPHGRIVVRTDFGGREQR